MGPLAVIGTFLKGKENPASMLSSQLYRLFKSYHPYHFKAESVAFIYCIINDASFKSWIHLNIL